MMSRAIIQEVTSKKVDLSSVRFSSNYFDVISRRVI